MTTRPLLLDIPATAEALSISVRQVYRLIEARYLRSVYVGAHRRVSRKAIEDYVARLDAAATAQDEHMRKLLFRRRNVS